MQAEEQCDKLIGFTAHFALWIAKQLEQTDLKAEIASHFTQNMKSYRAQLNAKVGSQSNTGRVIQKWSVLVTVYQLVSKFVQEIDEDYLLPAWQGVIVESVRSLRQERASEVFLDILDQLLTGGQVVFDDDMKNPHEYPSSVTVVGYKDDDAIYLLPEIAFKEVNKVQPLRFTVTAIGMQLKEDGILIPGPNNLSTQNGFVRTCAVLAADY